jgi:hypothetical protein
MPAIPEAFLRLRTKLRGSPCHGILKKRYPTIQVDPKVNYSSHLIFLMTVIPAVAPSQKNGKGENALALLASEVL